MKRTADTNQRSMRWTSGCAYLELRGSRPAYLLNRFAPRGSAVV